jgi:hypothetical protein
MFSVGEILCLIKMRKLDTDTILRWVIKKLYQDSPRRDRVRTHGRAIYSQLKSLFLAFTLAFIKYWTADIQGLTVGYKGQCSFNLRQSKPLSIGCPENLLHPLRQFQFFSISNILQSIMPWQCFQWKMHIKVRFGRTRNGLGW